MLILTSLTTLPLFELILIMGACCGSDLLPPKIPTAMTRDIPGLMRPLAHERPDSPTSGQNGCRRLGRKRGVAGVRLNPDPPNARADSPVGTRNQVPF